MVRDSDLEEGLTEKDVNNSDSLCSRELIIPEDRFGTCVIIGGPCCFVIILLIVLLITLYDNHSHSHMFDVSSGSDSWNGAN